jgi:hypothetical protein
VLIKTQGKGREGINDNRRAGEDGGRLVDRKWNDLGHGGGCEEERRSLDQAGKMGSGGGRGGREREFRNWMGSVPEDKSSASYDK